MASAQGPRFPELLETKRLLLRRPHEGDRAAYVGIWADPDVWRAIGPGVMGAPFDAAYAECRFEHHVGHWEQNGFGLWLVRVAPHDDVAGWVGPVHPTYVPELADEVEIAWSLRRRYWGAGIASEGAVTALQAAFEHLAREQVVSLINPANARSSAVAQRLGMRESGEAMRPDTGEVIRIYKRAR